MAGFSAFSSGEEGVRTFRVIGACFSGVDIGFLRGLCTAPPGRGALVRRSREERVNSYINQGVKGIPLLQIQSGQAEVVQSRS